MSATGIPIFKLFTIQSLSILSDGFTMRNGYFFCNINNTTMKPANLDITVAHAAPATPISGIIVAPLSLTPNINNGSNTMFVSDDTIPALEGVLVSPIAWNIVLYPMYNPDSSRSNEIILAYVTTYSYRSSGTPITYLNTKGPSSRNNNATPVFRINSVDT